MSQALFVLSDIVCRDAARAIDFMVAAFGAEEKFRLTDPGDGRVGHAELRIGESDIYLSDEYPDFGAVSPDSLGGTAVTLHLRCDGVDALAAQAEAAGGTLLRKPADQSFGERVALILDPFGHRWMLSQTVEAVTPAEMQRRWEDETQA